MPTKVDTKKKSKKEKPTKPTRIPPSWLNTRPIRLSNDIVAKIDETKGVFETYSQALARILSQK